MGNVNSKEYPWPDLLPRAWYQLIPGEHAGSTDKGYGDKSLHAKGRFDPKQPFRVHRRSFALLSGVGDDGLSISSK